MFDVWYVAVYTLWFPLIFSQLIGSMCSMSPLVDAMCEARAVNERFKSKLYEWTHSHSSQHWCWSNLSFLPFEFVNEKREEKKTAQKIENDAFELVNLFIIIIFLFLRFFFCPLCSKCTIYSQCTHLIECDEEKREKIAHRQPTMMWKIN